MVSAAAIVQGSRAACQRVLIAAREPQDEYGGFRSVGRLPRRSPNIGSPFRRGENGAGAICLDKNCGSQA
jgi:hypothetical protein